MTIKENYIFTGFGFDVLLHNVEIKKACGEEYPDINLNEIKLLTAKTLLESNEKLTGKKLKFLRTFAKLTFRELSEVVKVEKVVAEETLRSWEKRVDRATGLTAAQEKLFKLYVVNFLASLEKRYFEKKIIMNETFKEPSKSEPLEIEYGQNYSFLKEA